MKKICNKCLHYDFFAGVCVYSDDYVKNDNNTESCKSFQPINTNMNVGKLTPDEIYESVYGKNGLYQRTIDKINEMQDNREMSKIKELTNKKPQWIYMYKTRFKSEKRQITKLQTILQIAKDLGVE